MSNSRPVLQPFYNSAYYDYDLNPKTYERSVRLFRLARNALKVHIKLHDEQGLVNQGQILVINHFSRFETFIPQYLIYEATGAYCCSVAHREFFEGDTALASYLLEAGGIPHDYDNLLPLMAMQILRGRKVVIFPEGGMVKNRQVVDPEGGYRVYSRTRNQWRKQHTGAAVLGICLDLFKQAICLAFASNDQEKLQRWQQQLRIDSLDALQQVAAQPTLIIPTNITFYPIRTHQNPLQQAVKFFRPGIKQRLLEELVIEGNIMLRDTDMDIHLGNAVDVSQCWKWYEDLLITRTLPNLQSLLDVFNLHESEHLVQRKLADCIYQNAECIRDAYTHQMYRAVTVHQSHLAAALILKFVELKQCTISQQTFRNCLYLTIKQLQQQTTVFLHRSLIKADYYNSLPAQNSDALDRFLKMAQENELIQITDDDFVLQPKLTQDFDFDSIRMENLIVVYANEVAALPEIDTAIVEAMYQAEKIDKSYLVSLRLNDEIRSLREDKAASQQPNYAELNAQETATQNPAPFLLEPPAEQSNGHGVLMIHGLLASPAEMRPCAEHLLQLNYTIFAPRLKGHGTSPVDLAMYRWEDWYESVKQGYKLLADKVDYIHLVGFSTGGALGLMLAAEHPEKLVNVSAVCVPVTFRNPNMMLISLWYGVNRLTKWITTSDGLKPFISNDSEHPDINYKQIPVRALYELRQLIDKTENKLADINCPVGLFQSQNDPVVDPGSAMQVYEKLQTADKALISIPSDKHGILYENPAQTFEKIVSFLEAFQPMLHDSISE